MKPRRMLGLVMAAAACQPKWDGAMTALSNPDPARRVEAVQQIARTGGFANNPGSSPGFNPEELTSLVFRVNDPSPEVRAAIASALGALDNRPAADALATLVADPDEAVQLAAVASLARQRNVQAHAYLLLAYQRGGPAVRVQVVSLLKAGGSSASEAVSAEAAALYAEYSKELASTGAVRLIAAERLGSSGRPEAIERLTNYLAAESRSLALAAARGLGASGSPDAREPLEALLNEGDPALRLAGAEALGELGDPDAAAALLRTLPAGGLVAQAAMRSLVHLARLEGDGRAEPPDHARQRLCDAALVSDPTLTLQAANAILAMRIACSPEKLRLRLAHGDDAAGALAAAAELWAGDTSFDDPERARLAQPIGALLRNGTPRVRPLAARAAGALRLATLAPEVERARKEAGAEVQRARERWIKLPLAGAGTSPAASAPSDSGQLRSVASLFEAEPQAALELWAEASVAALRLGLPETAGLGATLANVPAPAVRIAAARAMPALPAREQWGVLRPLLEDSDPDVRAAARLQLPRLHPSVGAQAGPWILAELTQTASENSVSPLVEALGRFPDLPGLETALISALDRPETASAAAEALGLRGGPAAMAAIVERLRRPYVLALPELLAALTRRASSTASGSGVVTGQGTSQLSGQVPGAADACRALLFHPRPEVRAAAVRALFVLSGPEAFVDVQPLAGDYDLRVRRAVAER